MPPRNESRPYGVMALGQTVLEKTKNLHVGLKDGRSSSIELAKYIF